MKAFLDVPQFLHLPQLLLHQSRRRLVSSLTSYYEAINNCEQEVPEYFNFASDVLDKWTQMEKDGLRPSKLAFWWVNDKKEEVKWSFEKLGILSQKVANMLCGPCGLQRGDRMVTALPRIPEWWLLNVACMRAGIVLISGTSQLTAKDIAYRLQASKAKSIVVSEALAPVIDSIASECRSLKTKLLVSDSSRNGWLNFQELFQAASADHDCVKTKSHEPSSIFFTSGSTGFPKMVEHSHCSYGIGFTASGSQLLLHLL
uniref:medium-chain acyl-CoA ligase n=1 Tax=Salvator merianae TaxID=96440 RepID=A0A8D0KEL9_SALMN